jgi:D-lactate dehydrogenase (cytochrome)
MDNKDFLFKNNTDVGVYIKIPIYQESMDQKVEEWNQILSAFDDNIDVDNIIVLNDSYSWNKFFEARHSMPDNVLRKTKKIGGISIITDTIVPPKNYKEYVTKVHKKLQMHNIEYLLFGHLGDCHLHFHLIPSEDQHDISLEVYDYMVDLSAKLGGVYSAEHGTGKRKRNDFQKCYGDEAVKMVQLLKQKIDPNFLLNRGNIVQPIDHNEAN